MINSEFSMSIWTANWIYVEEFINRMYMNMVNRNFRDFRRNFLYEFSLKIVVLIVY
jgi:hypothetical protein